MTQNGLEGRGSEEGRKTDQQKKVPASLNIRGRKGVPVLLS